MPQLQLTVRDDPRDITFEVYAYRPLTQVEGRRGDRNVSRVAQKQSATGLAHQSLHADREGRLIQARDIRATVRRYPSSNDVTP